MNAQHRSTTSHDPIRTAPETMEQLCISRATLDRLVYERQIPYIKIGSARNASVRFRQSAIDEFLASHTVEAAPVDRRTGNVQPVKAKRRAKAGR